METGFKYNFWVYFFLEEEERPAGMWRGSRGQLCREHEEDEGVHGARGQDMQVKQGATPSQPLTPKMRGEIWTRVESRRHLIS